MELFCFTTIRKNVFEKGTERLNTLPAFSVMCVCLHPQALVTALVCQKDCILYINATR